jgi:hypothetical protein
MTQIERPAAPVAGAGTVAFLIIFTVLSVVITTLLWASTGSY